MLDVSTSPQQVMVGHVAVEPTVLGNGGYGQVIRGTDTTTGELIAVKATTYTNAAGYQNAVKEVQLLQRLSHHEGIIGLRGATEIPGQPMVFMFLELASGDLLQQVLKNGPGGLRDAAEAMRYFSEVTSAVGFLHDQGIAHRDLKLENILLVDGRCKLCDFGLSTDRTGDALFDVCGSLSYAAPEVKTVTRHGYDGRIADIWSLGVSLFAMLCGFFPFTEASAADWRFTKAAHLVAEGESLTKSVFALYRRSCHLSLEAVDLIDSLMTVAPKWRCTARDALDSEWATGRTLDEDRPARASRTSTRDALPPCSSPLHLLDKAFDSAKTASLSLDSTPPVWGLSSFGESNSSHFPSFSMTVDTTLGMEPSCCDNGDGEWW